MSVIDNSKIKCIVLALVAMAIFSEIAFASDAIAAYSSSTGTSINYPKIRFWNSTGSGSWGSEIELPNSGNQVDFAIVKTSPVSDKIVLVTLSDDNYLDGYVCMSNCTTVGNWKNTSNIGHVNGVGERRFDLEFESATGDAIVVYSNFSSSNGSRNLAYKVLPNATRNFTGITEQYIDDSGHTTINTYTWVRLDRNPVNTSEELLLIGYENANDDINAWVWNGNGWGNQTEISPDASSAGGFEALAVRYAADGSKGMALGANGTTGRVDYKYWNGASWSALASFDSNAGDGDDVQWLNLKADPATDDLQAIAADSADDLHAAYWSGSAWTVTSNIETNLAVSGSGNLRPADFEWESTGSTGRLVWGNETAGIIRQRTCSPQCSGATSSVSGFVNQTRFMTLYRNPTSADTVKIIGIRQSTNVPTGIPSSYRLGPFSFNGTSYSSGGNGGITNSPLFAFNEAYSLAFLRPAPAPVAGITTCVNITTPGDYLLGADLTGAPNPLVYPVCIKINSSDVSLDCQGHSLTSTASPQMGVAILNAQNVTVKNCRIRGYYHGIYSSYVDSGLMLNNSLYDGSSGVLFTHTTNILLSDNSAYNNTFGFNIEDQSNYNRFENNLAYNNTQDGFYIYNSHYSNFTENSATYNLYYGFHLYYADNNRFIQNNMTRNGYSSTYHLSQLIDGAWEEKYSKSFDVQYSTESFPLKALEGKVILRVVQSGSKPFAAIDQIKLESCGSLIVPSYAKYVDGGEDVLADILETDNNVVVSSGKEIEISWVIPSSCDKDALVYLTANEYFAGKPILYPYSGYLSFEAGSEIPVIDGSLSETDGIIAPTYSAQWTPDSGHPAGNTYVYLATDAQNVYISIDVTSDNTKDYAEDWVEAVFPTPSGEKSFRVDDLDATYGKCGFGLTSKASYKHKYCEFSIPIDEIGAMPEQFRLRYYGTSSLLPSGIFLELSDNNNVTDNNISDNLYAGAYLYHSDYNEFSANAADRNGMHGFYLYSSDDNGLENNGASDNDEDGFLISGGSDTNTLALNTASGNGEQGIIIDDSDSNTLTGNSAFSNDYHGIYLLGAGYNVLENNNASYNTYCGIILGGSSNNNLTDNLADGNSPSGSNDNIELYNAANNNRLLRDNATSGGRNGFYITYSDSNYLGDNLASGNALSGFRIDSGSTGNILENSNGSLNLWDGIYVEDSDGNTIDPSSFCGNSHNGVSLNNSNGTSVIATTACGNGLHGFYVLGSSDVFLGNNTADGSSVSWDGFMIESGSGLNLSDNRAYDNGHAGFETHLTTGSAFGNNTGYNNQYGFVLWDGSDGNSLTGNDFHDNTGVPVSAGIYIHNSAANLLASNLLHGNSPQGLLLSGSDAVVVDKGSIYGNPQYGAYILSSNATFNGVHFYNNGEDNLVNNSGASPVDFQLQNAVFDSPDGVLLNFTNLSLADSVSPASAYMINWTTLPLPLPSGYTSFNNKSVLISSLAGTVSLDSVVWSWTPGETTGYVESRLQLKRNSGSWLSVSAALSTSAHTLTATNLASFSTFAILQAPPSSSSSDSGGGSSLKSMLVSEQSICPGNLLKVYVTSGDKPLANATVTLYLGGVSVSTNASDANGVATFKLDKDGQYTLTAAKTGYKDRDDIFMYTPCPPECAADKDCPASNKCILGACVFKPECTRDSDCGSGKQCLADKCQLKPECSSDSDCGSGKECKSSKCQPKPEQPKPECVADSECGSGKLCNNGKCEVRPECAKESDCQSGYECKDAKCIKKTVSPTGTGKNASGSQPGAGTGTPSATTSQGSPLLLVLGGLLFLVILAGIAYWYISKNKGQKGAKK